MLILAGAALAVALELFVFLSPMLHESTPSALLLIAGLHTLASALAAGCCCLALPARYQQARIVAWLLLGLFAFVAPVIGAAGLVWVIRLHQGRAQGATGVPPPVSVPLPEFDVQAQDVSRSGQGSIRSRLKSHVPGETRLQSLMTLQAIPTRVANPILEELLSDHSDDVRLVAFGMLDAEEKKINADIQRERKQLELAEDDARRHTCLRHLAELHWELIYASLAQGELKQHILRQTLQYVNDTLALESEPDAAMLFLKGRILLAMGDYASAQTSVEQAVQSGHPPGSALPYLAELAYQQRDFDKVRHTLRLLETINVASRTRAVADLWTGRITSTLRSDRIYLPHL